MVESPPPSMRRGIPTTEESRRARQHAEDELRRYHQRCAELAALRDEIAQRGMGIALSEQTARREATDWSDPTARRGEQLLNDERVRYLAHLTGTQDRIRWELALSNPPAALLLTAHLWGGVPLGVLVVANGWDLGEAKRWRQGIVIALAGRMGWL